MYIRERFPTVLISRVLSLGDVVDNEDIGCDVFPGLPLKYCGWFVKYRQLVFSRDIEKEGYYKSQSRGTSS